MTSHNLSVTNGNENADLLRYIANTINELYTTLGLEALATVVGMFYYLMFIVEEIQV